MRQIFLLLTRGCFWQFLGLGSLKALGVKFCSDFTKNKGLLNIKEKNEKNEKNEKVMILNINLYSCYEDVVTS